MKAPLLDTHIWVWWVLGDARLKPRDQKWLDGLSVDERPFVCAISLWEVAMLVNLGRLELDVSLEDWFRSAAHPRSVRIVPLTPDIACEVAQLPDSFHRDPADRIIIASCRVLDLSLMSYDKRLRSSRLAALVDSRTD